MRANRKMPERTAADGTSDKIARHGKWGSHDDDGRVPRVLCAGSEIRREFDDAGAGGGVCASAAGEISWGGAVAAGVGGRAGDGGGGDDANVVCDGGGSARCVSQRGGVAGPREGYKEWAAERAGEVDRCAGVESRRPREP